jgi:hypothetical protein
MRSVFTEKDLEKLKAKYGDRIELSGTYSKAEAGGTSTDGDLAAVSKFIPAEVISVFVAAFSFLELATTDFPIELISWVLFFGCLVATIVITFFTLKREKVEIVGIPGQLEIPGQTLKTVLTTIAFIIWAFNIKGFTGNIEGYSSVIGGLLLIVYTGFAPRLYKYLP